jgi:ABC-type sugar transport system ATPase subunit
LSDSFSGIPVARLKGIRKFFGSTLAVDNVDLDLLAGEVHALVGENGAGKSTLMRTLAGMFSEYEGVIEVEGQAEKITSPRRARRLGIAMVHQELSLVPELSAAENIFLGKEPGAAVPGFISRKKMKDSARDLLQMIGVDLDPGEKVGSLSVALRQLVEIAKGLSIEPRVIVFDEPTSSLTAPEISDLFKAIERLSERGTAVVYISHKLDEVFSVADRITVMRDGKRVATDSVDQWTEAGLIKAMVGRELSSLFPHDHAPESETVALEVKGLSRRGAFQDLGFKLYRGEVLGIYGLIGAGRTELSEALFGLSPASGGEVQIFSRSVKIRSPGLAKSLGIALVPEDRRGRGLVLMHAVSKNLSLPVLKSLSALGFVKRGRKRREVEKIIGDLGIQAASAGAPADTLSGGNQQKVVIGKWLMRPPRILILDEPTRGIDVGAKAEVHRLIDRLAAEGMAIILISSELPEIMGMSDRILVMRDGEIADEFSGREATAENLGAAAAGVDASSVSSGGAA